MVNDVNDLEKSLQESTAKFVILGIPEDMGVKPTWVRVVPAPRGSLFYRLSLISRATIFLEGSNILMLGHFDFEEMEALIERNAGSDEEKD